MRLYEKHRPRSFDTVVGQDKAIAQLRLIAGTQGYGGKAVWLSGPSGSGKTTLARIVAGTLASEHAVTEYDSGWDFGVEQADAFTDSMCYFGMGKGGRALIVNEAHTIRSQVIAKYLGVLERLPMHAVVVFTTTVDGMDKLSDGQIDAAPLLSRCHCVKLTSQGLAEAFATDCQRIARSEGLDGKPVTEYVKLMRRPDVKNNYRAALQLIEAGFMSGGEA